jgi:phospholipase C
VYDHASVLKLIETRWGLEPLTVRDAEANDMMAELNFGSPDYSAPVISVPQGPFVTPCKNG